jgi:hypothetical protein
VYAQGCEPGAEAGGGDRLCWCSSGEQPRVVAGAADDGVSVAAVQELAGELVQGCGQVQGRGAQGQLGPVRGEGDLVPGEAGDAGRRLSVEQWSPRTLVDRFPLCRIGIRNINRFLKTQRTQFPQAALFPDAVVVPLDVVEYRGPGFFGISP